MGRLFDLDSPVMRFLSRMADVIILNLLVIFTSFPIITAGASFTAMHYVLIKMVKNEENYIFKMFFKSFKENFLQATILWLIELVIGGVFIGDFYIMTHSNGKFSLPIVIAILAIAVIIFMASMYVFPLQARFVNTIGGTLKNSFLIMLLNLPKSVLMMLLYFSPIVLLYISEMIVPFWIMFGISGPALGAAYLYKKVFERFEPEAATITSDDEFSVEVDAEVVDAEVVNGEIAAEEAEKLND